MKKQILSVLILALFVSASMLSFAEEKESPWKEISQNLFRYTKNGENTYFLKSGDKAVMFGATTAEPLDSLDKINVSKVEWCFLWNARRSQVMGLPQIAAKGVRIAAPDTAYRESEAPENHFLQRSSEYWEMKTWFMNTGTVHSQPDDMPLFTIKPNFVMRKKQGDPFLRITWKEHLIDAIPVATPHRRAVAFVIDVNDKRVCISGRMILKGGKFRNLTDIWRDEYDRFEKSYSEVDNSVTQLIKYARVEQFYPETGEPISSNEAVEYLSMAKARLQKLADLFPEPSKVTDDSVAGITKFTFKGASYTVHGGDNHYLIVNAGFPPAIEMLTSEIGKGKKCDFVFPTDARDIHSVSVPSLAEDLGAEIIACGQSARIFRNPKAYLFPKNCNRPMKSLRFVEDGATIAWRGNLLHFQDLPELGAAKQMMLYESGEIRVLFLGDALIDMRRFPIANPYYGVDIREESLRKVISKIRALKPTHIADDSGLRKLPEAYSLDMPMKWFSEYRDRIAENLLVYDYRNADPLWCRPVPNVFRQPWGVRCIGEIVVRNPNNFDISLKLTLTGKYLKEGADWWTEMTVPAQNFVVVPVEFTVEPGEGVRGTAVGIKVEENGVTSIPTQFILTTAEE